MPERNSNKLAIIVSSYDNANSCWEPLMYSFAKFWPDCPFEKFLITNHLDIQDNLSGFRALRVGKDEGWASNLLKGLKSLSKDYEYVLYMQEDFWLTSKFDSGFINKQIKYCDVKRLDYLRLTCPWMDQYAINQEYALSPIKKEQYALCLSAAIWRRESLKKLLIPGWSGWDFEANVHTLKVSDYRSEVLLEHISRQYFPIIGLAGGAVRRGRWTRDAIKYLKQNGFNDLIPQREIEGIFYTWIVSFMDLNIVSKIIGSRIVVFMHRHHWNF